MQVQMRYIKRRRMEIGRNSVWASLILWKFEEKLAFTFNDRVPFGGVIPNFLARWHRSSQGTN